MSGAHPHSSRRKANDSAYTGTELATMAERRAEARRLLAAGDVPHFRPDGLPIGLDAYVALCRAGLVAAARSSPTRGASE